MSRRKNRVGFFDRFLALFTVAAVVAAGGWYLWNNIQQDREVVVAHDAEEIATIAASTVSYDALQKEKQKILDAEKRKKLAEQKRLQDIKNLQLKEQQELEALKENRRQEEIISLKKKKERERKEKELKEKKRKEKLRKKKQAEEQERKKKEAEAKAKQERADDLRRELLREKAARATTTLVNRYAALMQGKIKPNFIKPISADINAEAGVSIRLNEFGVVQSVMIARGSGDYAFDQAALAAVGKSSPLPMPTVTESEVANIKLRDINLTVK